MPVGEGATLVGRRSRRLTLLRRLISPIRPLLMSPTPVSVNWGFDRGQPIDRVYIDRFVERHRSDIRGHVLEVLDARYGDAYGTAVARQDVLDIDPGNPAATIVADLTRADAIPAETFDCFILTQTLQLVVDPTAAVTHAHRILKPGGVLLATVPCIGHLASAAGDRWRFTELSCQELFGRAFGAENVEVSSTGNLLAAVAFLAGMAAEEIKPSKLTFVDPAYPLVVCVRAVRTASTPN